MSGHERSVKEWRERAERAEARAASFERQVKVLIHMLEERDATLRQFEFNGLVAQVEAAEQHVPTDESPDGPPPLVPVKDDQGGDYESTPDLEAEVE